MIHNNDLLFQVTLCDCITDELLEFNVNRWLSVTEEDGQISREIAVRNKDGHAKPGRGWCS